MREVSIVVPVFNNEGSLAILFDRISQSFEMANIPSWYVIFVDDGSSDLSLSVILSLRSKFPSKIHFVAHVSNIGQVGAIASGLKYAKTHHCFILSADLQEPASLIDEMLQHLKGDSSIIIAKRIDREESLFRIVTSCIFYRSLKLILPQLPEGGFDTFIISGEAKEKLTKRLHANRFLQADVLASCEELVFVEYIRQNRPFGNSQWTFKKKLRYFKLAWLQVFPLLPILFIGIALLIVILNYFVFSLSFSTTVLIDLLVVLVILFALSLVKLNNLTNREVQIRSSSIQL
jgi:glycosyltransferase involved in cell wall biosynthesis